MLARIQVDLDLAIAAGVFGPCDGGGPGAGIQPGRVVDDVGAALQRRLQAGLRDGAVAVVAGQGGVEGKINRRLSFGKGGGEGSRQGDGKECEFHVGLSVAS